ncbi:MAG: hypothetical protein LBN34_08995 [Clostridiales Family XIII bacterium]|nr:hypothetical protein [Clostridiales Family XIII bacterium]
MLGAGGSVSAKDKSKAETTRTHSDDVNVTGELSAQYANAKVNVVKIDTNSEEGIATVEPGVTINSD